MSYANRRGTSLLHAYMKDYMNEKSSTIKSTILSQGC